MARSRDEIEAKYKADMDVAESYRTDNPERYAELSGAAKDRRADGLGELADESDRRSTAANLESARVRIQAEFPKAAGFPGAFGGNTEDEIRANAKAASDYIVKREADAAQATRLASRGRVAAAWSPSGSPIVPGTEIRQESGAVAEAAQASSDRMVRLRETAGTPAAADVVREVGVAGKGSSPEEGIIGELRRSGRMRSTSDAAFQGGGPKDGGAVLTEEDRRG